MKNRLPGVVAALLTLLAIAIMTASPAAAQISLTMDESFITVSRPDSGAAQFALNGTVTPAPDVDATFLTSSAPSLLGGDFLPFGFAEEYAQYVFANLPGVGYSGRIIIVEVSSSDDFGDYFFNSDGGLTQTAIDGVNIANQQPFSSSDTWGVRVIDGSAAAPEPSALALLLPVFLVVAARRRR